jgi:hypothetical protein
MNFSSGDAAMKMNGMKLMPVTVPDIDLPIRYLQGGQKITGMCPFSGSDKVILD